MILYQCLWKSFSTVRKRGTERVHCLAVLQRGSIPRCLPTEVATLHDDTFVFYWGSRLSDTGYTILRIHAPAYLPRAGHPDSGSSNSSEPPNML